MILMLMGIGFHLEAQRCSCAGAPIFNPLEFSTSSIDKDKQWHFELSFKYHAINDLVKPTPRRFQIISKFRVPERFGYHLSHLVINKGRLYVRAGKSLMVYWISRSSAQ